MIAAGLLSLTLVAACSDDADRRSTALPPSEETSSVPEADLPSEAPSAGAEDPVAATSAPAKPVATKAASTTATKTSAPAAPPPVQPTTQQTQQAAPKPASDPSPTRTATRAPAPAPSKTAAPAPAPASQFALTIKDFTFSPRILNIPVGSTVTSTNQDEATHDWTSDRGVWGSGDLRTGQMFSFTFKDPGKFDYLCERHPQMTGTINVT